MKSWAGILETILLLICMTADVDSAAFTMTYSLHNIGLVESKKVINF